MIDDDDGSSSVALTPDMLPEYYNDIGLQLLNGAELKDRVSQGGRRGVKATQDIAPNSEVMRVPITSIISMGGIQKYPELTKALSGLDITATVGLSVLLAYERYHIGESSQYYKYDVITQAFGTVRHWQAS